MSKRFYWIKLKTDFFEQETIDFLMSQKNGCQYIVLYQMLCLKTANTGGELVNTIGEMIIPYDINKIVRDTKYFDVDTVTVALELFSRLGLIYYNDNNSLQIANYNEMVGSETDAAERMRKSRANKALQSNNEERNNVTGMLHKSIEYKSIDNRDKDIKSKENKTAYGEFQNVLLTNAEYEKVKEQGLQNILEELSGYIASTGKRYKSHYATILNWKRRKEQEQEAKRITEQNKKGHLKSKPTYNIEEIERRSTFDDDYEKQLFG